MDSPTCKCGHGAETVKHFLLECPRYSESRKELRKEVAVGKIKVAKLLGDKKIIKHTGKDTFR
jgi:hypothetical protein